LSRELFAREGRRIIAQSGGLTARSIKLLSAAAKRHDVPIEEMAAALSADPSAGNAPATQPIVRDEIAPSIAPASLSEPVREPVRQASRDNTPEPLATLTPPRPITSVPQSRLRPITPPAPRAEAAPALTSINNALADEIDPAQQALRTAITFGAIVLVGLVLGLASIWMIVTGLSSPAANNKLATQPSGPASAEAASKASLKPNSDRELFPAPKTPDIKQAKPTLIPATPPGADPITLVRALGSCAEQVSTAPVEALKVFKNTTSRLSRVWPSLAPDQIAKAQNSIVEFMYQAAKTPEIVSQATLSLTSGADPLRSHSIKVSKDQILPSVWAVGLARRLTSERDLPADARAAIDAAANASSGRDTGDFAAGAASAIVSWPAVLARAAVKKELDSPAIDLWREWLSAVDTVAGTAHNARSRFVMSGLEVLLIEGPEPADAAIVTALIRAARWQPQDESRSRLLGWFDNTAISSNNLRLVTLALAADSTASGVDPTMVLDIPADELQRRDLREKYAAAWDLRGGPARDEIVTAWAAAAKSFLDQSDKLVAPSEQLARAVVLSRLSESASLIWAGRPQGVATDIQDADKVIVKLLADAAASAPSNSLDENNGDGAWAIEYLRAEKSVPDRGTLLSKLSSNTRIGPVDAEVLAAEAFRGSPTTIRKSAQDLVAKFAASPAMVNAALEQSVNLPRTNENADLLGKLSLSTLPGLRDPLWRTAVRRGLVERLLEMVAARGDQGLIDRLADLLAESYRGRVIAAPTDIKSGTSEKVSPEVAARAARGSWLKWAQARTPSGPLPITLDQIQRRIGGRSRLASGMIQGFAAEQIDTAELMAFVIAVEQPASKPEVASLLDRLGKERRNADHIFGQVLAAERAMIELWALRLGVNL